jgi:hypothetical protein
LRTDIKDFFNSISKEVKMYTFKESLSNYRKGILFLIHIEQIT